MTAPTSSLPRALGLLSTTLLVVGGIIGGGIFFTPSVVAQQLPDANWIVAVWTLGGIVALAGALTYAELGAMLPESGGPYVYIREAFGPLPRIHARDKTISIEYRQHIIAPAAQLFWFVNFPNVIKIKYVTQGLAIPQHTIKRA